MPNLPDSGFDKVAPFYDALARLIYGDALQKAQLYLLPFIPDKSRVLVIGGGSGWLLKQLILTGKQLDILYVDASPRMLNKAEAKYKSLVQPHSCQVIFRLGTEAALAPHEQFNVIITPFLLDLYPPQRLRRLMQKLSGSLTAGGLWLFADFCPVQYPMPWWQKTLVWGMYTFFGAVSGVQAKKLPEYDFHFDSLGLQKIASESFYSEFVQGKVFIR
ncbi:ubiquinone/menaquinone biosynthesis C-methylase UbiE [Pontibacter aydingkolensis]|uniref:Class I SAM-dependent methyltransferase n=1 Tax=Pontibacter aydingkolensis TaxID=1911536 RepID=A0ABS7CYR4_9BACT|nr:class I SAM-dependent methyltransferase [Pontibacter aydingkolensis]MBW7468984.1 class I SAM-dependent methyltransferase [Pontibacter aydingkolensis]